MSQYHWKSELPDDFTASQKDGQIWDSTNHYKVHRYNSLSKSVDWFSNCDTTPIIHFIFSKTTDLAEKCIGHEITHISLRSDKYLERYPQRGVRMKCALFLSVLTNIEIAWHLLPEFIENMSNSSRTEGHTLAPRKCSLFLHKESLIMWTGAVMMMDGWRSPLPVGL